MFSKLFFDNAVVNPAHTECHQPISQSSFEHLTRRDCLLFFPQGHLFAISPDDEKTQINGMGTSKDRLQATSAGLFIHLINYKKQHLIQIEFDFELFDFFPTNWPIRRKKIKKSPKKSKIAKSTSYVFWRFLFRSF